MAAGIGKGAHFTYALDVVLCVDATAGMRNLIRRIGEKASEFDRDLRAMHKNHGMAVSALRIRVIAFRDIYVDGENAIIASGFFALPSANDAFVNFVRCIEASGGGQTRISSGLEALALAIQSDWNRQGERLRHVIVVCTDARPHPLEQTSSRVSVSYPNGIPANFNELTDWWDGITPLSKMDAMAKRLIVFAPDAQGWTDIGNHWTQALHYVSRAGEGLAEVDYQKIIETMSEDI